MEDFLMDYVTMIVEANEIELSENEIEKIVKNIMETDEIWDFLDENIYFEIENIKGAK